MNEFVKGKMKTPCHIFDRELKIFGWRLRAWV
jgi:hypothetical protein